MQICVIGSVLRSVSPAELSEGGGTPMSLGCSVHCIFSFLVLLGRAKCSEGGLLHTPSARETGDTGQPDQTVSAAGAVFSYLPKYPYHNGVTKNCPATAKVT